MIAGAQQQQQRHDVFVGNLSFNTTEEQLHQVFSSEIGKVLKVRMVTDPETGRPRGFAFIEFDEPHAALSAIRNMNDYELNGRRLRVNFSNSSHLEALAGKLGMDLSQAQRPAAAATTTQPGVGTQAVAEALKGMSKGEMYDVIAKLKEISERDQDEARRILSGHPQLPEAILFLMSKLDMMKTPLMSEVGAGLSPAVGTPGIPLPQAVAKTPMATATTVPTRVADPRARAMDPRAAAAAASAVAPAPTPTAPIPSAATAVLPADPRAQAAALANRVDPRTRAGLPSGVVQQQPPRPTTLPPPPPQQYSLPQPQTTQLQHQMMPQQQMMPSIANLEPSLVQQVMSLTPQQIAQLPIEKQQSILALRQQIASNM